MRSILTALSLCLAAAPAAAQNPPRSRCDTSTHEDGELVFESRYRLDRSGRVVWQRDLNDRAAFATTTRLRRDARGGLRALRVLVLEGPSGVGWRPPITVRHERRGSTVVVHEDSAMALQRRRTAWTFDTRGLPVRVELDEDADGVFEDTRVCEYDASGRPVSVSRRRGARESSIRWVWSLGQLVRVESRWRGEGVGDDALDVVAVDARTVVLRTTGAERGEAEERRWTGRCDALLFDVCSPALAPPPPGRAVARLPDAFPHRRSPPPGRARRATAFPPPWDGAQTLPRLRALFPAREVWPSSTVGESDPSYGVPTVCVGVGGRCSTELHLADGVVTRARTTDPGLVGPRGLTVGATFTEARAHVEDCRVDLGLETGMVCRVRDAPGVTARFTSPVLERASATSEEPTAEQLVDARLESSSWAR